MKNSRWAERISQLADEALADGAITVAVALKCLSGSLYSGMDREFSRRCMEFSKEMVKNLAHLDTSKYN